MPRGWFRESYRHSLAAKGLKTQLRPELQPRFSTKQFSSLNNFRKDYIFNRKREELFSNLIMFLEQNPVEEIAIFGSFIGPKETPEDMDMIVLSGKKIGEGKGLSIGLWRDYDLEIREAINRESYENWIKWAARTSPVVRIRRKNA